MTEQIVIYDITIIGTGPVGLFAAFYSGLRKAKTKIIESLGEIGGQPTHLFPDKAIHDIPAYPEVKAGYLISQLEKQALQFSPTICLGETVENVDQPTDATPYFTLHTNEGLHYSKTIILAVGNGAFSPRKLTLDEAVMYEDGPLHYFVGDLNQYKDKVVAITGGGDSAVDWALTLEPIAKQVHLIHRRPKFRALESSIEKVSDSSVEIHTPFIPSRIIGDGQQIEKLVLTKPRTDETRTLDIDDLIVSYGFTSSLSALEAWQLKTERNAIWVDDQFQTSTPGIFAIGDCAYYDGKVKLIATGFGEAPQCVNSAMLHIDPTVSTAPVHFTGY